eukprot:TRINITY_DN18832_c0_g1_i1.p1 TRINITY_DN18832_c0_g1~~TRINITY_DN18832_c0_g1_i1.p1  ORF type:complete len:136 (-),score=4.79 TRINITY_DN18832_c0_g1_i1:377-784(-)
MEIFVDFNVAKQIVQQFSIFEILKYLTEISGYSIVTKQCSHLRDFQKFDGNFLRFHCCEINSVAIFNFRDLEKFDGHCLWVNFCSWENFPCFQVIDGIHGNKSKNLFDMQENYFLLHNSRYFFTTRVEFFTKDFS